MKLATLVSHLQTLPAFAGRVSAATTLDQAIPLVRDKPSPSCVLFGVTEHATPHRAVGIIPQAHLVNVEISLLLVVRYAGDTSGGSAFEALDTVRQDALSHLIGWQPTGQAQTDWQPLEYTGGKFAYAESGLVIWHEQFATQYYWTP